MGGLPVSRRIDIEEEQRWRQPGLLGIGLYTAEEAAKLLAVRPSTVRGGSSDTPISSSTRLPDTSLQRSGLPKRPAEAESRHLPRCRRAARDQGFRRHGIPLQ